MGQFDYQTQNLLTTPVAVVGTAGLFYPVGPLQLPYRCR
jgi:hypothetical protein